MAQGRFQELYGAINSLSVRDRALLHMLYWDGVTFRKAAAREDVAHSAVAVRHKRILRDLHRRMIRPEGWLLDPLQPFEAQAIELAAQQAAQSKGRNRSRRKTYPPLPGWVQGRSWPDGSTRGWGAPTWACGHCRSVLPVSMRRCNCSIIGVCNAA